MKAEEQEKVADLLRLRRAVKGIIPTLEKELAKYEPICKRCFNDYALVDKCRCEQNEKKVDPKEAKTTPTKE